MSREVILSLLDIIPIVGERCGGGQGALGGQAAGRNALPERRVFRSGRVVCQGSGELIALSSAGLIPPFGLGDRDEVGLVRTAPQLG